MIYIGIGANLPSVYGSPLETLKACCRILPDFGIYVKVCSPFYQSAAMPCLEEKEQADYVNAVLEIRSRFLPHVLLKQLQKVEKAFGREHTVKWGSRCLDLDLLDWCGEKIYGNIQLPHYGIETRAFVLKPLIDIAPNWRHPILGASIKTLYNFLPVKQYIQMSKLT